MKGVTQQEKDVLVKTVMPHLIEMSCRESSTNVMAASTQTEKAAFISQTQWMGNEEVNANTVKRLNMLYA